MRVIGALFTGGLTLFLVRYLGPDDYGVYSLALGVGGLLLLPADFGVSRSAARFMAERREDPSAVGAVLRHALRLKSVGTGLVAIALIGLAGPISSAYDAPDLEWPIRVVAVAILGQSFMLLFTTSFEALGQNAVGFRLALSESALEAGASTVLVLAGAGVVGATAGRAGAYSVAALLGLAFALPLLRHGRRQATNHAPLSARSVARYAGALFVIDAAFAAFSQVDILMIGAFLGARASGLFSAPAQILLIAAYPGLALAGGVAPRLARVGGQEPNVDAYRISLRWLLLVQLVIAAPVVVWATPITHLLLGSGYEESAGVFRALSVYAVLVGPGALLALGINYLGEARRRVPLAIAAVAINAGIDAVLIPKIGVVAGAIGTDVAFTVFVAGHLVVCRSLIELPLRPLAVTALRGLLAAAAMAAVLFAFGTSSLSAVEAVAGSIAGLAAYAAILILTRELSRSELSAALRTVRARL
jgi:O-antigen/teichoic acid export membrane protein